MTYPLASRLLSLCILLLVAISPMSRIHAQITERPILIATLSRAFGTHPTSRGFRSGMESLGYRENEDYIVGDFYTRGNNDRLDSIVDNIVAGGSHIVIAMNEQASISAKRASGTLPVLFSGVSDPIGIGLIDSFAQPGRQMTGIADLDHELDSERLKRFRQLLPNLNRLLYAYQPGTETERRIAQLRKSASTTGISLIEQPLISQAGADAFFAQIRSGDYDAILSPNNASLGLMGLPIQTSMRTGIPTFGHTSDTVEAGALASYGASYHAAGVQLARLVDKIINGAAPGDIPVEVNRTFEFSVNLAVARQHGIAIPREVLYQADRVLR